MTQLMIQKYLFGHVLLIETQILRYPDSTTPEHPLQIHIAKVEKAHAEDHYCLNSPHIVRSHEICSIEAHK